MIENFCRGLHGWHGFNRVTRAIRGLSLVLLAFNLPLLAKCPISDGATLVVRAPFGDLLVDTTSRDASVDVQIDNNVIQVQEVCGKGSVEYTGNASDQMRGTITWRIVAPKGIDLDLVTLAGNINVGDVDGDVILRTSGGSVTAGQIKGKAAIITQGGFIKSGNVGGNAELRSQGGTLEVDFVQHAGKNHP